MKNPDLLWCWHRNHFNLKYDASSCDITLHFHPAPFATRQTWSHLYKKRFIFFKWTGLDWKSRLSHTGCESFTDKLLILTHTFSFERCRALSTTSPEGAFELNFWCITNQKKALHLFIFCWDVNHWQFARPLSLSLSRWVKSLLLFFYAGKLAEGRWGRVLVSFFFSFLQLCSWRLGQAGRAGRRGKGGGEGGRWGRGQTQSL